MAIMQISWPDGKPTDLDALASALNTLTGGLITLTHQTHQGRRLVTLTQAEPCCTEYGVFQDRTSDGLGHSLVNTHPALELARAAAARLDELSDHNEVAWSAYVQRRPASHGRWTPVD